MGKIVEKSSSGGWAQADLSEGGVSASFIRVLEVQCIGVVAWDSRISTTSARENLCTAHGYLSQLH